MILMKYNKTAFTLTEMLVVLVISAIIAMMVSAMSTVAAKAYNDLRNQSGIYNDSQFALQLIREAVRRSYTTIPSPSSTCLTVPLTSTTTDYFYSQGAGNLIFGVTACGDTTATTNRTILSGVTNLVFTPSLTGSMVSVTLSGKKNNASFSYSISATRRNP